MPPCFEYLNVDGQARMTTEKLAVGLVPVDLRAPMHYDDGVLHGPTSVLASALE